MFSRSNCAAQLMWERWAAGHCSLVNTNASEHATTAEICIIRLVFKERSQYNETKPSILDGRYHIRGCAGRTFPRRPHQFSTFAGITGQRDKPDRPCLASHHDYRRYACTHHHACYDSLSSPAHPMTCCTRATSETR